MASSKQWFIFFVFMIYTVSTEWISVSNPRLPRGSTYMAVGSYNSSIFILGGYTSGTPKQLVEFKDNHFIDYGTNILEYNTYGSGDFYTQIDHMIYMLSTSGSNLNAFDMSAKQFISSWKSVTTSVSFTGCLTSVSLENVDYLYVVGGFNEESDETLNNVQVLNTNSMEWLSNIPSMNTPRNRLSCIVDPSTLQLYAIAGKNGQMIDVLSTIEKINVVNIELHHWEFIPSTLTQPVVGTRCIMYQDSILVIGGRNTIYLDTMYAIDPNTDTISLPYPSLPHVLAEAAALVMNNDIYVFGGQYDCGGACVLDTYMLYPFSTPSSTSIVNITMNPSSSSTKSLTTQPTSDTSTISTFPNIDTASGPTADPNVERTTSVPPTHISSLYATKQSTDEGDVHHTISTQFSEEDYESAKSNNIYIIVIACLCSIICIYSIYRAIKKLKKWDVLSHRMQEVVVSSDINSELEPGSPRATKDNDTVGVHTSGAMDPYTNDAVGNAVTAGECGRVSDDANDGEASFVEYKPTAGANMLGNTTNRGETNTPLDNDKAAETIGQTLGYNDENSPNIASDEFVIE